MFPRIMLMALYGVMCSVLLVQQSSATFQNCPSPHGKIEAIRVTNCTDKMSFCVLKKGSNASIEIDFLPSFNASSVKVKVIGEIAGVPIPFSIEPDEACGEYGLSCPLTLNKTSKFDLSLPILQSYPPILVKIKVKLIDETDTAVACIMFPAKISY